MPLTQEDENWTELSKDWPYISSPNYELIRRLYWACSLEEVVPYGSYLMVGDKYIFTLRTETDELKQDLLTYVILSPLSYHDLADYSFRRHDSRFKSAIEATTAKLRDIKTREYEDALKTKTSNNYINIRGLMNELNGSLKDYVGKYGRE
jgi:CRISPR/Cas system endoribonuclease Cas6 (RAMP superfamily)